MENNSTVIFLDYFENLQKVAPFIKRLCVKLRCKPIIISSNYDNAPLIEYLGLKVIYFDELLSDKDYEFMDSYIFKLTQSWYLSLRPVQGITAQGAIQFGELVEENAQRLFSSAIKRLDIALKIVEHFHPDRIILVGEKHTFQGLCVFIKEQLHTLSLFIKMGGQEDALGRIGKRLWNWPGEIVCCLCNSLMRRIIVRKKRGRGVLIEHRLYFELNNLGEKYYPYLYIVEKGLRIRWKLIKDKKLLFAPVLMSSSFRLPNFIGSFCRYWNSIRKDEAFQSIFTYKNLLIWHVLEKTIKELIIYDFPLAKKNIRFLENLYRRLEPKIVIAREAVRMPEKSIVLAARQAGIPTLVIQHGMLVERNVYTNLLSDKIAVWGKAAIDWYGAYGNDTSKCIITGRPGHDLTYLRKNNYKEKAKESLLRIGADPDKETILYLPNHFKKLRHLLCVYYAHDSDRAILKLILGVSERFPDKQLIIKVHPFDPVDIGSLLDSKLKRYPNVFIVKDLDMLSLIENSSLIIASYSSSAILDAIILNKPIITINFSKREELVPLAQRGVALSVASPEQLYQGVKRIFEDKGLKGWLASNREGFITDYAYKIDGNSTERVLGLVNELYDQGNGSKE